MSDIKTTYTGRFLVFASFLKWSLALWWALSGDCSIDPETECSRKIPDLNQHADIHFEVVAWDFTHKRFVSLMFNASGANPRCGIYHLQENYEKFPFKNGVYTYTVDFYAGFKDCWGVRLPIIRGQAVVVKIWEKN